MERDRKSMEKCRTFQRSFRFQVAASISFSIEYRGSLRWLYSYLTCFHQVLKVQWERCGNSLYWNKRKSSCRLQQQSGLGLRSNLLPWAEPDGSIYLLVPPERRPCWPFLRKHNYAELLISKWNVQLLFFFFVVWFCFVLFCLVLLCLLCPPWFSEVQCAGLME